MSQTAPAVYKRVLLKISGEGFCEEGGFGIEPPELELIAAQCVEVARMGVQLAVVVGGGNFIRGATFSEQGHIPRATADYMGMLATVLNALALQEMHGKAGPADARAVGDRRSTASASRSSAGARFGTWKRTGW